MKKLSSKHSFFDNTFFMFKTLSKWDKTLMPMNVVYDIFVVIVELGVASFATSLTYCLENRKGLSAIILVTIAVTLVQIFSNSMSNILWQRIQGKRIQIERNFDVYLGQKVMDMDFDLLEGPVGREKYQKAKNALTYEGVYAFTEQYGKLFTMVLLTLIYGTITVTLNPWLILILTILEALKLVSVALESRLINSTKAPIAKVDRRLNYVNRISRDFSSAKDIRLYQLREYIIHMSEYFIGERKFWTQKMYFYYFCTDMISLVLSVGIEIGIFIYIVYAMLDGSISKTELVLYVFTVTEFAAYLTEIGNVAVGNIQVNMEIGNLREFLDIKNTARNSGGKALPEDLPCEIELQNVSFSYPESDKYVLKNINLKILKGENLALVGVNGAGKTTLVKIICGLYRPTEGKVLINGTDISEFNRDDYYRMISAVFQDPRIMPCSILENVSMLPERESNRERFFSCIKKAGLYEKIQSLDMKENTLLVKTVNESAVELSGGETQRLLLARAIYKDAPILILDEPTAALDPIAENEIYLRYSEISKNRTSIYISHRLSSTRFCDRIVLLDENSIAEIGTHDELMSLDGKYAEMYGIQSKYYRKEKAENDRQE